MRYSSIALLMCACQFAHAADFNGNYAVWGVGRKACFHFSQAKENDPVEYARYLDYTSGYFTAFNVLNPETYNIAGRLTLDEVVAWLDDYCAGKGMHSFDQALADFAGEHLETRAKTPPGRSGWR